MIHITGTKWILWQGPRAQIWTSEIQEAKEEVSNSFIARSSEVVSGVWDGKYYSGILKENTMFRHTEKSSNKIQQPSSQISYRSKEGLKPIFEEYIHIYICTIEWSKYPSPGKCIRKWDADIWCPEEEGMLRNLYHSEDGIRGSGLQDQPLLHVELEISLGYMTSCPNTKSE